MKRLLMILVFLLAGCGVHETRPVSMPKARPPMLAFLVDGHTPRETVLSALGQPSRSFEGGRILSYRLGRKYESVASLRQTRFSLILVFDAEGLLARHGLVRVR